MYYLKYLRHYLISHSRHGTHSPFVYQLVDEVIYQKPTELELNAVPLTYIQAGHKSLKKYLLVERLLKTLAFNEFKIQTKSTHPDLEKLFEQHKGMACKRVIHYIDTDTDYLAVLHNIGDQDLLMIEEPHLSKERDSNWERIKGDSSVTVTIDLFYFGLVFFRKGQRKEDFLIRF
ncbi:hypothetical protein LZQ00_12610 [Sphingobacterium sp. SRCM116780]|uniref:hypothetical protein n=1 Tax=Sphingobacterium sp. SRCM116780 TaxID=2907623 RepID=UPI001F2BCADD|nr:hypothetical protein [Sphingobacterium sp. SRCM116780]UIR55111.1 hypothetical protein LZQ00_12610 [Sphingobacterium sp. SRCM116780]